MKKMLSVLLILVLTVSAVFCAFAEETKEYRDQVYSFRYPASWNQGLADNGDIVLEIPGTGSAALTFAIITDLIKFSGDAAADAPGIESMIAQYSEEAQRAAGKNTTLNGKYDLIESGGMHGFRAYGTWLDGGRDLVMVLLTGNRHMVSFVLIGQQAIAAEQDLVSSVELLGSSADDSAAGFKRWDSAQFSLDYPAHFGVMEQTTGVIFVNPDDTNCIIMARTYNLDADYSDTMVAYIATAALPKSTKVEAEPEMVQIAGRTAAVIKGNISVGPMAFYVIGSGKTAMALMFTGEEANAVAEHVILSIEIK